MLPKSLKKCVCVCERERERERVRERERERETSRIVICLSGKKMTGVLQL